jgi:hypothetical protein
MRLESAARLIGHISFQVKLAGKRSAGNLHAAFDVAGTGNVALTNAPVLDPTCEGLGVKIPRPTHPYIPMEKGFLFMVAIIDLYSRYVLAWRLSNSMETGFCVEALK